MVERDDRLLTSEIETELVNGLIDVFESSISEIILYGSVARGEDEAESDVDVAIILTESMSDDYRKRFLSFVSRLDIKYEKIFSVVDIDQEQYTKWNKVLPFYKNIKEEGIVLWKAA